MSVPEKTEEESQPAKPQSVARSAGIVSIAVMFSRVLGLVRETIFARYFGAGFLYDAFIVGFRIPNLLRDLFAEGALSAAFVKVFTDYQLKNSEKEAWRLASLIFNGLAVILSVICIAGIFLSPLFVKLITYNYLGDPNHYYPPEKSSPRDVADADNVPVHLARCIGGVGDGRAEHKRAIWHSGIGFDGIQHRVDRVRHRPRVLAQRRSLGKIC